MSASDLAKRAAAKFVEDNELAIEDGSTCEEMAEKVAALLDEYVKDSKEWQHHEDLRKKVEDERRTNDHRLLVIGGLTRKFRTVLLLLKECQKVTLPEGLMAEVAGTIAEIEYMGPTKVERNHDEQRGFDRAVDMLRNSIAVEGVTPPESWKYRDAAEWLVERVKARMS